MISANQTLRKNTTLSVGGWWASDVQDVLVQVLLLTSRI